MDEMYLFKSQDEGNRLLYAYYKGEFWFYDPNVQQWYISGHVREQYELAAQKDISLTPDDFTCTGYGYEFVAEYEVPVSALDALRTARKISPKEEPVPGQDTADAPAEDAAAAKQSAENPAAPEDGANPTAAAPASPADVGAATQSLSAAGPASLEAPPSGSSAFDYTGLDDQTVADLHLAEREYMSGRKLAEVGLRRMADGVAIAHEALCGSCDIMSQLKHGNRGEASFGRWCDSVGLNRKAAERLLQVSRLFDQSSPNEEKVLETLGPTLLYAAAKPSAPAELVQAVKDGDITTNKQYQDLLARYNAERAAREKAEQAREESRKIANTIANQRDEERRRASEAEKQRDGARNALQAAKLRGDKLKAENDALKAHPIEAQVVDEEEIDRRAQARANELTAPLREELEALRSRHPADPEEAEQAIRDAYDSAIYTSRTIENAWHSLRPLLSCMDSERRVMAVRQLEKILTKTQEELRKCL